MRLCTWILFSLVCSQLGGKIAYGQATDRPLDRFEFNQIQMGMPFRLVVYAHDEESANAAARAAFARIKQLNGVMSDYDPDSELMQLCRTAGSGKPVPVSRDLQAVLTRALALSKKSDGAFDVTVGPLVKLWRKARKTRELPPADELADALKRVGYRHVRLDEQAGTVELLVPGMQLDLGGIGVGYAVDEALAVLKTHGIRSALLDGSGDIGVSDAPPGTAGWRIGIAPLDPEKTPSRYLLLKNGAVTTSGDAYQFVEVGGKRYSHIVDPQTGLGLSERSSVTVIAGNCTDADSFTKAVSVLGPVKGLALIDATPGMAAIVVRAPAGKPVTHESQRITDWVFEKPAPKPASQ
ncbi:MAG: FAD:protein FMN transferase [Planctomycetes bacterium]|nr:FAD:protein FMN transferase [Planctomycetota bacterium]